MLLFSTAHVNPDLVPGRDRAESEERSEAILSAHDGQQMSLGGADHPDGGLLGRRPRRETRLRPHQDLHGQAQQVRKPLPFLFISQPDTDIS